MIPSFDISIIVPTFNRTGSLIRLLESLDSLEFPDSVQVEILIVDNGSTDETESLLRGEQAKARKFSLRVLQERQRGKASALNLGLASVKGNLILIVDDDVVVHSVALYEHFKKRSSLT